MKTSTLFALAFALAIAFLMGFNYGLTMLDNGRPIPPIPHTPLMEPETQTHEDELLRFLPGKQREQIKAKEATKGERSF